MVTIMASNSDILDKVINDGSVGKKICSSKILIVGSGGIGVEVIKNVVLLGFKDITLIDLDTIDVSNLNRQFLFNKSHVGKPKSLVAAEVAVQNFASIKKNVNIIALHDTIMSPEYSVDFFRTFKVVINALDNRASRSHVNRMCLAANVPLIESGSEGYLGQVFLIKKDVSACYECDGPRQEQRTYASCTIRNTPSLPIHCIVWGKHLFAQLFGGEDADNDVSPDMNDPELGINPSNGSNGSDKPRSTTEWAKSNNYDDRLLFEKLFKIDIEYLLKMGKLWENRPKPTPLSFEMLQDETYHCAPSSSVNVVNGDHTTPSLKDQKIWSLPECYEKFSSSLNALKNRFTKEGCLVWDKDDDDSLNFVTAVSNLRSCCFNIERKSLFDVKSMAGNIIPAISSTNSVVGGLITLQLVHLLKKLNSSDQTANDQSETDSICKEVCRCIYLRKVGLNARNLISSYQLFEPNPNCLVCSDRIPEIELSCPLDEITMSEFVEQVLFKKLSFVCPDVQIDGQAIIIWSKDDADLYDEDEKKMYKKKLLNQYPQVGNKTRLRVNDLLQDHSIIITLVDEKVDITANDGQPFTIKIISEGKKQEAVNNTETAPENENGSEMIDIVEDDDDDGICLVASEKRKLECEPDDNHHSVTNKKIKV